MREIELCREICANPKARYQAAIAAGKKVVGVMPYFCPEELVYAAGMLPFGLWGAELQANESKRYFPAFICSILHTTLEMGLRGELNDLSAIMIPISCDSLKGMGANWEYGVKSVPVINVAYAENRRFAAGVEFTVSQFRKIQYQLEKLSGKTITDGDIAAAIAVYNANRSACLAFTEAAAAHPELVSVQDRAAVLKARLFMDAAEHTALVETITARLLADPVSAWKGLRIVTTGPLVLSASAHMEAGKQYTVTLDLKPGLDAEKLDARLVRLFQEQQNKDYKNVLDDLLPRLLIPVIIRRSGIPPETKCNAVTKAQRQALAAVLKRFTVAISGTRPIEEAVITRGGIDLKQVDPGTMESRLVPGLYFAGEILDLDAYTGGYNLQIAWATGRAAGLAAAEAAKGARA